MIPKSDFDEFELDLPQELFPRVGPQRFAKQLYLDVIKSVKQKESDDHSAQADKEQQHRDQNVADEAMHTL